ncbi:endonuclease, putative [Bodo saltans]|uniref:Endonuclease, putative n=2 Tax=Bodo saltans TaxID=75058 RepID=A0A0S4JFR1_BODSA|nr:endonuclease, putative [Bodo saltans]|eukprot:CUG90312.1 endonuclease, putative [Bodo saltans]
MMRFAAVLAMLGVAATASVGFTNCSASFLDGFVPHQPTGAVQICKDGAIAISYDVPMIDPAWSAYYITPAEANKEISGRLDFYADPDLKTLGVTQAAVNSDAFNTSWNRGHLAPSHILSYTQDTKKATYTMANIAPQYGTFNQQPWNQLETKVFDWIVAKSKALYIVTGVAYKSRSSARRTFDNIAVPDYYWKVICDPTTEQSAGFYGSNNEGGTVKTFSTVQDVETLYGGSILNQISCNTGNVSPSNWWTF